MIFNDSENVYRSYEILVVQVLGIYFVVFKQPQSVQSIEYMLYMFTTSTSNIHF